jgi:hypothetical protein
MFLVPGIIAKNGSGNGAEQDRFVGRGCVLGQRKAARWSFNPDIESYLEIIGRGK